tara:strand:- start:1100 stop:2152 length:1053 start_codon:yes stop_codon:yes gene_type:complete
MKRIILTGGAGYIGSHTCLSLLKKGYEVFIVDSFINSSPKSIKRLLECLKNEGIDCSNKLQVFKCDLRDKKNLEKVFLEISKEKKPIWGVVHFAGLKSVTQSFSNPFKYWHANVVSSINLFELMAKYNCKTLVFSSSATIYGLNGSLVLNEQSIINPCNPYGTTKYVVEKLLNDIFLSSSQQWRIANLRYFNPIGAHESGMIGENPIGNPNNIFPTLTKVAIGEIEKLMIFGNDWPTHDGTGVRDYIHIMDLAEGHVRTLEYLQANECQLLNLNLGTGKGTSVLDLINKFEKVNNVDISFEFTKRRKGDHGIVIADNSLSKNLLNWSPSRNLDDMCRDGWKWQINNPNGY